MGRATIFDPIERVDRGPSRRAESRFASFNRSPGPEYDRIRDALESWFQAYPVEGRADLRGRLRSESDDVFTAAFWELYQHQTLTRMGHEVVPHPGIPGTARRPDFLVIRSAGDEFYLEATIASPSEVERGSNRLLHTIYDLLDDLPTPNFFLAVEVDTRGTSAPATKGLRRDLLSWLEDLDPDELLESPTRSLRHPPFAWKNAGSSILFRPIAKSPGYRGTGGRAIGMSIDEGVHVVDTSSGLRNAIKEKAGRYGMLDRPYVIAVLIDDRYASTRAVVDALFGTVSIQFDPSPETPVEPRSFRQLDGPWMSPKGPTNTRVSAVMTAINLAPALVNRIAPQLWHNPLASRPLAGGLHWAETRVVDGALANADARATPTDLLGLPAEWPMTRSCEKRF